MQQHVVITGRWSLKVRIAPSHSRCHVCVVVSSTSHVMGQSKRSVVRLERAPRNVRKRHPRVCGDGVRPGARILVERPLLSLPEEVSYEDLGPLQHQADSIINTAVAALSRAQRAQLFQLQDCRATAGGTASTASGILYTNAFSAEPGTTGYFLTAARFNHSCTPNVGYSWNASLTAMTMHAHVDVAAGEELLISYKARYAPRSSRREALHAQYRFTCHCKVSLTVGHRQPWGVGHSMHSTASRVTAR